MSWSPKVNADLPKGTIGGVLQSISDAIEEHKLRKQLEESTDPDVQALKPYIGAVPSKELIPFIVKGKLFKQREEERRTREEEKRSADAAQKETELRNQARKEVFVARKKAKIRGVKAPTSTEIRAKAESDALGAGLSNLGDPEIDAYLQEVKDLEGGGQGDFEALKTRGMDLVYRLLGKKSELTERQRTGMPLSEEEKAALSRMVGVTGTSPRTMAGYFERLRGSVPRETGPTPDASRPIPDTGRPGPTATPAFQGMPGPRPPMMVPSVIPSTEDAIRDFQELIEQGHDLTPQLEALRRKDPAILAALHLTPEEADAVLAAFAPSLQGGMGQFSLPIFGQGR